LQIFFVQIGGEFLYTTPLSLYHWIVCVGLAAFTIPVGMLSFHSLSRLK